MPRQRLAGLAAGRRSTFAVLVLWLALITIATPLSTKLGDVQGDSLAALPSGVEAAAALERAEAAFPEPDALVAVVVYARQSGLSDADRAKAEADRAAFVRYADGGVVASTVPSEDGKALLFSFPLAGSADDQSAAVDEIKDHLESGAPVGLRTALTGSAGAEGDLSDAFSGMDGALLLATATAVTLLLLITYRSPVLWLIPLISVVVANRLACAVVYLLARHTGLAVDFQSQSILTVLVFGVGVDYALLLIARYREELRHHHDRYEAMALALRRSCPAILASGGTVAIGLLCLCAARIPATHGLGPVAAIGVVAALVAMTTLLPAVLVVFGRWLFWPFVPHYSPDAATLDVAEQHGAWSKVAAVVGRRARAIWIGSAITLGALTLGLGNLSIGLPENESYTTQVGSVTGQQLIEAHYPGGTVAPAVVLAIAGTADQVAAAARAVDGVARVETPQPSADGRWVRIRAARHLPRPQLADPGPGHRSRTAHLVARRTRAPGDPAGSLHLRVGATRGSSTSRPRPGPGRRASGRSRPPPHASW